MIEWPLSTIGAQATLQRGFDVTRAEQRAGTIPVISSGGIGSFHDTAAGNVLERGPLADLADGIQPGIEEFDVDVRINQDERIHRARGLRRL